MPVLNKDKCYAQQPLRLNTIVSLKKADISDNWLTEFYDLVASLLDITGEEEKNSLLKGLNQHTGPDSTYTLKSQLHDSLKTLHLAFKDPQLKNHKKVSTILRIEEGIPHCTPGFHDRVNDAIINLHAPENIDEMLARKRQQMVGEIARQTTDEVHAFNRFFVIAQRLGYGVRPLNEKDIYNGDISDKTITAKLNEGFAAQYGLFAMLNSLQAQLEELVREQGYNGKCNSYAYADYSKFDNEFFKPFVSLTVEELFESEIDEETLVPTVLDINWPNVKMALLTKLYEEKYVSFSPEEAALLTNLLTFNNVPFATKILTTLLPNDNELAECLVFFNEWTIKQKAALVTAYLQDKSLNEQKKALAVLDKVNGLPALLKSQLSTRQIYLSAAVASSDMATVKACVEGGADINSVLSLLFSKDKEATLYWLHDNPALLATITASGLNALITEGKYQGKTVAEALVSTKKGRQLLLENQTLQALLPDTIANCSLSDWLKQAKIERHTLNTSAGFFKKHHLLATQLGQYIVNGEQAKAETLLQANSSLLETLLTEKVTVIDYSKRKVKRKTAFQAALCAWDDEMCEMLAKYMSKEEIARQYKEIFPEKYGRSLVVQILFHVSALPPYEEFFPEGHEPYIKAQTPFNFSAIIEAIEQSNHADVKKALHLEQPNHSALWKKLEQFRSDFTEHSLQETVFNPQHLLKAFEIYDKQCKNWDWNKQDLFWRQVIGYVQRFLPANMAQDFAQGIFHRAEEKEKSNRSFKFRKGDGAMYPLSFDSLSGLGYEYAVNERPLTGCMDERGAMGIIGQPLQSLCQTKVSHLQNIMQPTSKMSSWFIV